MIGEQTPKDILLKYPLTVWCNKCGLIGYGDPDIGSFDASKKIYWVKEGLSNSDVLHSITDLFICPNCKKGSVLFRDPRIESLWVNSPWVFGGNVPKVFSDFILNVEERRLYDI